MRSYSGKTPKNQSKTVAKEEEHLQDTPQPAELNVSIYAQGTDIHIAPGQENHLAHEAWQVVQQKQGRAQPTMNLNDHNINDDSGLEQ